MTLVANQSERQSMLTSNVGGGTMGSFKQRPAEAITYEIDYTDWLAVGETISSVSYTIAPTTTSPAEIVGSTIQGGTKVLFKFDNGLEGTRYIVNVTINTSTGQTKQDFFSVVVGTFSADAALYDITTAGSDAIDAKISAQQARDAAQGYATAAATARNEALAARDNVTSSLAGFVTAVANLSTWQIQLAFEFHEHVNG